MDQVSSVTQEPKAAHTMALSVTKNQKNQTVLVLSFINVLMAKIMSRAMPVKRIQMTVKPSAHQNQNVLAPSSMNVKMEKTRSRATPVKRIQTTVKPNAQKKKSVTVLSFINVLMAKMRSRATPVKNLMATAKPNAQLKMMVLLAKRELSGVEMEPSVHAMLEHKAAHISAQYAT